MSFLISIIVPIYNLEKYIQRTLESLFAQTHRELEVIAVDDGSTDASPCILDEYATREPRLRVIHQTNAGVTAARNAGLEAATGDYIGFCDGDDIVEPTMYERLLNNLLKYDADISHCGMQIEGLDGKTRYFYNTGELCVQNHDQGLIELLAGERVEPTACTKLYKRKLFDGLSFDPEIRINEDLLMNALLFQRSQKSVFEDVCLYHYIRREGSASKGQLDDKHIYHPVVVRERILEQFKIEKSNVQKMAITNYLRTLISICTMLNGTKEPKYLIFADKLRRRLRARRNDFGLLPFAGRVHAFLIAFAPSLYSLVHLIYYHLARAKQYG